MHSRGSVHSAAGAGPTRSQREPALPCFSCDTCLARPRSRIRGSAVPPGSIAPVSVRSSILLSACSRDRKTTRPSELDDQHEAITRFSLYPTGSGVPGEASPSWARHSLRGKLIWVRYWAKVKPGVPNEAMNPTNSASLRPLVMPGVERISAGGRDGL
jgi:hypothetical protein